MSFASDHKDIGPLHFRGAPANTLFDDGQVAHLAGPLLPLQNFVLFVAHSLGMPSSIVAMVLCQFAALPLAFVHNRLRNVTLRHLYSTVLGAMFLFIIYGWTSLHLIGLSSLVYVLIPNLPKGLAHSFIFCLTLGYLACGHVYHMIAHFGVWQVDFTASLMIAVIKLITFACNWDDGLRIRHKERLHKKDHLHEFYAFEALERYPTPLEFASYMLFYGGVSSGPVFCMREFLDFQDHTVFRKNGLGHCPSPVVPCFLAIFYAISSYLGVFMSGYMPLAGYVDQPEFLDNSFSFRLLYVCVGVALYRTRYYLTWYLGEASCIAAGLGFDGITKNEDGTTSIGWERVNNVRVLAIETGTHIHELTDHWNRRVSEFLKYYVYFRVSAPAWLASIFGGPRTCAMLATRVTSAFWHGFYTPYYMFFVSVILLNEADRLIRKHIEPLTRDKEGKNRQPFRFLYITFCKLFTFSCMNYFGASFTLLVGSSAWHVWRATRFYGHVVCIAVIAALSLLPSKPMKSPVKAA